MKLGTAIPSLKKIKRHINQLGHPLSSAGISIFDQKLAIFVISGKKDKN